MPMKWRRDRGQANYATGDFENEIKRLARQMGYRMTDGASEKVARLSSKRADAVFDEIRLLLFRRLVSQMDNLDDDVFVITAFDVPDQ